MGQRTLLYDLHLALGAKTVDFGGWDMPLHYGSQVEEHHQVRSDCGVFDVSHMTVIDVDGTDATAWLQSNGNLAALRQIKAFDPVWFDVGLQTGALLALKASEKTTP